MQLSQPKKMYKEKFTTRRQLQGYGASSYHAEVITKNLTLAAKQGQTYIYAVSDVIVSIRDYLQRPRVKPTSRQVLDGVLQVLLERLSNVIEVPFGRATNPEINKLARQLSQSISDTDKALAELEATAATIKSKYSI